jgi:transposase
LGGDGLFSYVSAEARVPAGHPLRAIRAVVDGALEVLSPRFEELHARTGRPSVPPEKLIRALLVQAFFSIRSERQLMQRLDHNLLFRWFVGRAMNAPVWDATTFAKNRERLLDAGVTRQPLAAVLAQRRVAALMSDEHFSVDGTLIQAWASHRSFRLKDAADDGGQPPTPRAEPDPKGRNAEHDFRGEKRSNATHASTTDPDARLARKSNTTAAILAYGGDVPMENRHGLIAHKTVSLASGTAERDSALHLLDRLAPGRARTLGADRGHDTRDFVAALHERGVAPHIARDTRPTKTGRHRTSAVPAALTRTAGHVSGQRVRKRIGESFAWVKEVARLRPTRHRGLTRVSAAFSLAVTAYQPRPPAEAPRRARLTPTRRQTTQPHFRPPTRHRAGADTRRPARPIRPRAPSSAAC